MLKAFAVAVIVPILFVVGTFVRNANRGGATGRGGLIGSLLTVPFLITEVVAVFTTAYLSRR